MPVKELQFWTMLWCKKSSDPLTPKTIEIPHTPKPPFGDATLSCYYGDNKDDRIFIIFHDPRSRIDLNWRLIIFFEFNFVCWINARKNRGLVSGNSSENHTFFKITYELQKIK